MVAILIISGCFLITTAIVSVLRSRYQRIIKEKNRGIVSHIREQERLKKEMECINTEKNVLKKMVEEKLDTVVILKTKECNNG
jgi:CBS domain containing-hemolysin-like protein